MSDDVNVVQQAQKVDGKKYAVLLERNRKAKHGGLDPQPPEELNGYSPDEVMAALDVLAQEEKGKYVDEVAPLDPFGLSAVARVGTYVAHNTPLGQGFTRYSSEGEAIRAFADEVNQATAALGLTQKDLPPGLETS